MSIAYDASTSGEALSSASLTYSHTCGGSADLLVVTIWTRATGDVVTGVTYNGVSMTRAGVTPGGQNRWGYIYYLASPATGANDVVVSTSASDHIRAGSVSYTGADTTTPLDTTNNGSDTGTPIDLTITTGVDDVALVGASTAGVFSSAGTNTTNWYNNTLVSLRSTANVATAGATSLIYTPSSSSGSNEFVIASFRSAAGGGSPAASSAKRVMITM